eukprot:COSAG01_NODE_16494_length_1232_cov_1.336275_2_plen_158_part_00
MDRRVFETTCHVTCDGNIHTNTEHFEKVSCVISSVIIYRDFGGMHSNICGGEAQSLHERYSYHQVHTYLALPQGKIQGQSSNRPTNGSKTSHYSHSEFRPKLDDDVAAGIVAGLVMTQPIIYNIAMYILKLTFSNNVPQTGESADTPQRCSSDYQLD